MVEHAVTRTPCPGCGALVPDADGPAHRYIGASPGCWALFTEILALEYGDVRFGRVHPLTVDAYAAQHPGTPSPKAIRSVAIHLVSLHLVLERGYPFEKATRIMKRLADRNPPFTWLEPPMSVGPVTVADARGAKDPAEHAQRVERWARSVWDAWAVHHETVRRWAQA